MTRLSRRLLFLVIGLFALAVVGVGACASINEPRPDGHTDAAADALAQKMVASVDADAWARTGAITWTYGGRFNHLWDTRRNFARVRQDGFEALIDVNLIEGIASEDGVALDGDARKEAVQRAYAAWANDSFWLVAMNKAFDPGTSRARVAFPEGGEGLLVTYGSGGVTPGDAYLWHLDENGRPTSWQMWVSIIPIGGLSASWDGWVQLRTGAWVSTAHKLGPVTVEVTDLDGAATLSELIEGSDPFAALVVALRDKP